jgi:hypothetical protein
MAFSVQCKIPAWRPRKSILHLSDFCWLLMKHRGYACEICVDVERKRAYRPTCLQLVECNTTIIFWNATVQLVPRPPHCRVSRWQTIRHTHTPGRTPLNEWRAPCRGLHNTQTQETNIHDLRGIWTRDPNNQTYTLYRTAAGIGLYHHNTVIKHGCYYYYYYYYHHHHSHHIHCFFSRQDNIYVVLWSWSDELTVP